MKFLKWSLRLLVWFGLLCAIYVANYVYFLSVRFDSQPSEIVTICFNLFFVLMVYFSIRNTPYIGVVVGTLLMLNAIYVSTESQNLWQRKKYLYENYVIDFSYDKYCQLSIEDKFLMEEISIYGITDCDDAKIPYKKSSTVHLKKT